jgi:molybdopterin synthase sulfur carrier subunit
MTITVQIPGALAGYADGRREVAISGGGSTVAGVFDRLAADLPVLERRIRDEQRGIRRHVNVYLDGADIRTLSGSATEVPDGATVQIIAAVSGG